MTKQKELVLYFRLAEAASERVQKVFPIGALVSVSSPQGQLDKFNNLHILYQFSARGFSSRYAATLLVLVLMGKL